MHATFHFEERQATRGLRREVLEFVLAFGEEYRRAGAQFFTVKEASLPKGVDRRMVEAARGWVVVVQDEGRLVTCYRNQDAIRYITKKPKRDWNTGRKQWAAA